MPAAISQSRINRSQRDASSHASAPYAATAKGRGTMISNQANIQIQQARLQKLLLELDPESLSDLGIPLSDLPTMGDMDDSENGAEESCNNREGVRTAIPAPSRPANESSMPTARAETFFGSFKSLLPSLVQPFLDYTVATGGGRTRTQTLQTHLGSCAIHIETRAVVCISQDRYDIVQVPSCGCVALAPCLVQAGFFPSSPTCITLAYSMDMLDFYYTLYEESSAATSAMAAALQVFLENRGFLFVDSKGQPLDDPIRRSLGNSILWYDLLRLQVEAIVDSKISEARVSVEQATQPQEARLGLSSLQEGDLAATGATSHHTPLTNNTADPLQESRIPRAASVKLSAGACSKTLRDRCPACFGGVEYGRPHESGSDIIVAVDANFMQRHSRSSGETPPFYDATYFISKEEVDSMGDHIDTVRKRPAHPHYIPKVPDVAVDACQKTFDAADPTVQKTKAKRFDDMGIVALVCRHDAPLFLCNVDTPGEQQKYAFALLKHAFQHLPEQATVTTLYDIGCILDRSMGLYPILDASIMARLHWGTSVMHAYGHEWPCQLIYNPRLVLGMGLTDGEGTERLWSRMRKLIPITRSSGRRKRIYLLDRRASYIGQVKLDNLGGWIRSRVLKALRDQTETASLDVATSGHSVDELKKQWCMQQTAQTSVRAHAPAKLKKHLHSVLTLQEAIERVDSEITETRKMLLINDPPPLGTPTTPSEPVPTSTEMLQGLCDTQRLMVASAERLYRSLNIQQEFPNLEGMSFEFLNTLLMARDVKIIIRARLQGRFFEMSRLDQSAGGADAALGTKLHQASRANISKRTPATQSAIKKFNGYCATLAVLVKPEWGIALPRPLPTVLDALKDDPYLYEDVWIEPSPNGPPLWLADKDVRQGIKGMLRLERCKEEGVRLCQEAENIKRWFGDELAAVTVGLRMAEKEGSSIIIHLQRRYQKLLRLRYLWSNPCTDSTEWEYLIQRATALGDQITEGVALSPLPIITTTHTTLQDRLHQLHPKASFRQTRGRLTHQPTVVYPSVAPAMFGQPSLSQLRPPPPQTPVEPVGRVIGVVTRVIGRARHLEVHLNEPPIQETRAPASLLSDALDEAEADAFEETGAESENDAELVGALAEIGLDNTSEDEGEESSSGADEGGEREGLEESDRPNVHATPEGLKHDATGFATLYIPNHLSAVYSPSPAGFPVVDMPPPSFARLINPKGRLDDLVMNSAATLLAEHSPNQARTLILSTHALSQHRDGRTLMDVWKNVERARMQTAIHAPPNRIDHGLWILPIHRPSPQHWTIVGFDFDRRRIIHFDSFADCSTQQEDLKASVAMVTDVLAYASTFAQAVRPVWSDWDAYPALTTAIQRNGYDCGVWCLAQLVALLYGYECTGMEEHQITSFRYYIACLAGNIAFRHYT